MSIDFPSDGIEGIHGIGEADEPALCPCGKGYVGHAIHPAVVWCQLCPELATGDDELCTPHRQGVPAAISDPWLALNYLQAIRNARRIAGQCLDCGHDPDGHDQRMADGSGCDECTARGFGCL